MSFTFTKMVSQDTHILERDLSKISYVNTSQLVDCQHKLLQNKKIYLIQFMDGCRSRLGGTKKIALVGGKLWIQIMWYKRIALVGGTLWIQIMEYNWIHFFFFLLCICEKILFFFIIFQEVFFFSCKFLNKYIKKLVYIK